VKHYQYNASREQVSAPNLLFKFEYDDVECVSTNDFSGEIELKKEIVFGLETQGERYAKIEEIHPFLETSSAPLSTFR
jgi:hypothetical protein